MGGVSDPYDTCDEHGQVDADGDQYRDGDDGSEICISGRSLTFDVEFFI